MEPVTQLAPPTAATLAAAGVRITLVSTGVAATRVDLACPPGLAAAVRSALAWRVDAMRAQIRARAGLGAAERTLVAVPGLTLGLAPAVTWRGQVESYGRWSWQTRTAQRVEAGWCASCGEAHATRGENGDCLLCVAARIGALRAEGVIGAPTPLPPPPAYPSAEESRRAVYANSGLRALTPVPARVPWTCPVCGFENTGRRPDVEGCGACTNREDATLDMSRLGGAP